MKKSKISLDTLESLAKFESWLHLHLPQYGDEPVPPQNLLIYLSYMEDKIKESHSINRAIWLSEVRKLVRTVQVRQKAI